MELIVYWTQFSEGKLNDIFTYYNSKVGFDFAQKFIIGIVDSTIGLKKNPLGGQKEELLFDKKRNLDIYYTRIIRLFIG